MRRIGPESPDQTISGRPFQATTLRTRGAGPLKPDCRKQLRDDLKFLNYAPDRLHLGEKRQRRGENLSAAGTGRPRSAASAFLRQR